VEEEEEAQQITWNDHTCVTLGLYQEDLDRSGTIEMNILRKNGDVFLRMLVLLSLFVLPPEVPIPSLDFLY